jgi:predicted dehydrogenase
VDFIRAIALDEPIAPNFADGVKCMRVLEAGERSAQSGSRVRIG